jgi:hypothetical protein
MKGRHPFIRQVVHDGGKAPFIILYTDQPTEDLKKLCCTGQVVLGLDKTFNLCDMQVSCIILFQTGQGRTN